MKRRFQLFILDFRKWFGLLIRIIRSFTPRYETVYIKDAKRYRDYLVSSSEPLMEDELISLGIIKKVRRRVK